MKKSIKLILFAAIFIAVLCSAAFITTRPAKIEVVEIESADAKTWFTEDGTTSIKEDYSVISTVSGKISNVYVEKDAYVEKGTIIAEIDPKDYIAQIQVHKSNIDAYHAQIAETKSTETNQKDTYNANIAQLKAKLAQAESQNKISDLTGVTLLHPNEQIEVLDLSIEQCQIELDYDKKQYETSSILYEEEIISKEELDISEQKYKASEIKMNNLLQQKNSLEQEIERLSSLYGDENLNDLDENSRNTLNNAFLEEIKVQIAEMEKNAKKDYSSNIINNYNAMIKTHENSISTFEDSISDCTIVADKSGYITALPVKNQSYIQAGTLVCTIKENNEITVESYVSTEDIVHISIGDKVEMIQKTRQEDIIYTGTVTRIEDWAEERVSPLGIIEHKVKVTINPDEEMKTLGSGYSLDIKYFTFKGKGILVPDSAFYRYDGQDYVFIIERKNNKNEGVLKPAAVTKGVSANAQTMVTEGLKEGDIIVKNSFSQEIEENKKVCW